MWEDRPGTTDQYHSYESLRALAIALGKVGREQVALGPTTLKHVPCLSPLRMALRLKIAIFNDNLGTWSSVHHVILKFENPPCAN